MRRLAVLLAACSSAPRTEVANHPTTIAPPAVPAPLPGPRATITHRFLAKPISVTNPSNAPVDVATATGSLMIVTIDLGQGLGMMLSGDGATAGLGAVPAGSVVIAHGADAQLQWRVMQGPNGIDPDAFNVAAGVYCAIYRPDVRTQAQADRLLAACRDIHVATKDELADTAHVYSGD